MSEQDQGPAVALPVCVTEFERLAETRLPKDVWDFIAGGSGAETTLAANRAAFDQIALLPRVLAGIEEADPAGRLLGSDFGMPVAVAPMAYQKLAHPNGEVAAARAAMVTGVPYVASTVSSVRIEDIAAVGAATWFQLYWLRERSEVDALLGRAEDAGCRAIVVTVDVPILARQLRDIRNGFTLPPGVVAANLPEGESAVAPLLDWADLVWLRERTTLPLVVKGILDPRDAERAADVGVDSIVVSNHGGRQLDGAIAAITALPGVLDAVGERCEVLVDGGVRSGVDVLRALALGATGVLVGRPVLWGLAVDGARGAEEVLWLLRTELREALTLAGCGDVLAAREALNWRYITEFEM